MFILNAPQRFGYGFVVEKSARTIPREPSDDTKVGVFSEKFRHNEL